jgi:pimeloyl-ACP methyl ester carboxylesterase
MPTLETIRLDDGAETVLECWGDRGPVMLCVHGMTSSRKSWQRLAKRYADRYRVYAYDQRGHGDSAGVRGPMTLHRSLLDLYNVIEGIGKPVAALVGHSWGGAVVILGGRRFDVGSVVAIDPMIRQAGSEWYDEFLTDLRDQFASQGAARDERIEREYRALGWGEDDIQGKKHAVHAMTAASIERLRDENPPESWDLRADLEAYPKPLLLALADAQETIAPLEDLKFVRERGGAQVGIRVFDGQGHNLHRTDFDRFAAELDRFLERTVESPV